MKKIVTISEAIRLSDQLRNQGKHIVLAGGCFDILHIGHIRFLEKAKEQGDILFVMLESDATIKKQKGETRPIHVQTERATVLEAITMVDYVISLPFMTDNRQYDDLVSALKPAIIATTEGDSAAIHKERQAKENGAKVAYVLPYIENHSSSTIAAILQNEL